MSQILESNVPAASKRMILDLLLLVIGFFVVTENFLWLISLGILALAVVQRYSTRIFFRDIGPYLAARGILGITFFLSMLCFLGWILITLSGDSDMHVEPFNLRSLGLTVSYLAVATLTMKCFFSIGVQRAMASIEEGGTQSDQIAPKEEE